MGKLIKNHWARLLILTASAYQTLASIYAFFWPKVFFDFLTTNLDGCVRPIPILQIINLLLGLLGLAWEWPLPLFTTASTKAGKAYGSKQSSGHKVRRGGGSGNNQGDEAGTGDTTREGMERSAIRAEKKLQEQQQQEEEDGSGGVSGMSRFLAGMHGSIEARLMLYPLSCLASFLLYQATNAALYYMVGMAVYFWAFSEGEVVMGVPWTLPRRGRSKTGGGNV